MKSAKVAQEHAALSLNNLLIPTRVIGVFSVLVHIRQSQRKDLSFRYRFLRSVLDSLIAKAFR